MTEQLAEARSKARDNAVEALDAALDVMRTGTKDADRLRAAEMVLLWAFGSPAKLEADAQTTAVPLLANLKPEERLRALRAAVAAEESTQATPLATPSVRTA